MREKSSKLHQSPRLFYLDDIPTPYRTDVFRYVHRNWDGAFRVGFCAESEPGRKFSIDLSELNTSILPGYQWRPRGQVNPFSIKWNPGIVNELQRFNPDVVVLSGYTHPTMMRAARWCIKSKIPYAITCETSAKSTSTSGLRWKTRRFLSAWIVRNMSFGLPVGGEAASYLRAFGPSNVPMFEFPNTPDTEMYAKAASEIDADANLEDRIRVKYGLQSSSLVFTFVGRLIDAKRPLDAIRAFRRLPEDLSVSLVIVGDGPLKDQLMSEAGGDRRIIFTGWIEEKSEVARLLAVSSVFLLPSSHEPWGAVVNEAMAARNCVIATDKVGAAVELIQDGDNGFVVSVADVDAISSAMTELTTNGTLLELMATKAQTTAADKGADFAGENLIKAAMEAVQITARA